jgi:hypothetical protein
MNLIYDNLLKYRYLIIFFWVFVFLNPILFSGFGGDDSYNSQIYGGSLSKNHHWFFGDWYGEAKGWLQGTGRLNFFIGIITKGLFNYIHNFYILKFILLFLIAINVLIFGKVLEELKVSSDKVFLTLLLIPLFFQIRSYHDPISNFFLLIPFATTCIFLSILFFLKEKNLKRNILLSFLFLNLSLFTYEISFILIPIYFIQYFFCTKKKKNICILFPIYIIAIVFSAKIYHYNLGIKSTYPNAHIENFININNYVSAYIIQFLSAFPLSWRFTSSTSFAFINIGSVTFAILIYFYFKTFKIKQLQYFGILENKLLLFLCLIIVFLIPILPAISGHNIDLINRGLGYGYIPVYIQYFGLAPIFSSLFIYLLKKAKNLKIIYFLIFLIIFSFGITYRSNYKILSAGRVIYLYTPQYINFFIPKFDKEINISDNKVFIRNYNLPYDNLWNYTKAAKKLVNSCYLGNEFKNCIINHQKKYGSTAEFYGTAYQIDEKNKNKHAILVKFRNSNEILKSYDYNMLEFNEYYIINNYNEPIKNKTEKLHNFFTIAKQGLYYHNKFDLNEHIAENILVNLKDFWPIEINGKNKLSWLSKNSEIVFFNKNDLQIQGYFNFELIRPGNDNIDIKFLDDKNQSIYKNNFSSGLHKIKFKINLKPGINSFKLQVDGEIFNNGDPRKIKVGLQNWKFEKN